MQPPRPGTPEYERLLATELDHLTAAYGQNLLLDVPPVWKELEGRCNELVRAQTGHEPFDHVSTRLRSQPGARLVSLGSGPGGLELWLAEGAPDAEIVCFDVNETLLEAGREAAAVRGLRNIAFEQADLNSVELPRGAFDFAMSHAALHHLVELEHVAGELNRTLRTGGELVTVDIVSRNGFLLWPETREIAGAIFRTLPERLRLNHTAYAEPRIDDELWEADTSAASMECIRSEDIVPVLDSAMRRRAYVPYLTLARRFFDPMYGRNYDLSSQLDRAIFEWIWQLDLWYLDRRELRPETFFGIYGKR
jgi:ubiquinone/menaquinone biosynthesis C-methylase UbiE